MRHCGRQPPRLAGLAVDRQPHLARRLGADLVDAQGGEQADDGVRHGRSDHRDRLHLGGLHVRQPVEPRTHPLDAALRHHSLELVVGEPEPYDVPWPEERSNPGPLQIRGGQLRSHGRHFINVGSQAQVPTLCPLERRRSRVTADVHKGRPAPVTSASIRTMSPSMARMSASISSSGRGGV